MAPEPMQDHAPMLGENSAASSAVGHIGHTPSAFLSAPMRDMAHTMEMCCIALAMLALVMLTALSPLGMLRLLRPRAQLPTVLAVQPMRGIERTMDLGGVRI